MSTKKRTKKTSETTNEAVPPLSPEILQSIINVQLTVEELNILTTLLGMCESTYQALATDYANQGQVPMAETLQARSKLSGLFARKFYSVKQIGEPDSKKLH